MTTLVTGAGLVGAAYAQEALRAGERVVFLDPAPRQDYLASRLGPGDWMLANGDVRHLPGLIETMQTHRVDTVIHSAGLIGGKVQKDLSTAFDINIGGTRNVAEAVRLSGVRRLVHISTMGVYDGSRATDRPVVEDFPRGGRRGYGAFKAAKEMVLDAYAAQFGFEFIILRPANVYGVGHFAAGSSGGEKMQAMAMTAVQGGRFELPFAQAGPNEYIYSKDLGRAIHAAARIPMPKDHIFNIGNGYLTTFEEIAQALHGLNPAAAFSVAGSGQRKDKAHAMDITRAREQLAWSPEFDMATGLADYVEALKAR